MKNKVKVFCIVFAIVYLFSIFQMHSVSMLTGTGVIDADYNIEETEVYQEMYQIYDSYMADVKLQMEELGHEYIEEYTEKKLAELKAEKENEEETEAEDTEASEEIKIDVKVKITVSQINLSYAFAYLSMTDETALAQKKYNARAHEAEIIQLYNRLNKIVVIEQEEECFIFNEILSPEEAAEKFFSNVLEQEQFLYYYDGYYSFIGEMPAAEEYYLGDYYIEDTIIDATAMPLYYQYAQPWGSMAYGTSNIKECGCAPTCIAMVASYLNGRAIYPHDVVSFTGNSYYMAGSGSTWSIFPACADYYGLRCRSVGKNANAVIRALTGGQVVIVSMGPGTFTRSGHFIVLRGINAEGRVFVNDPNDNTSKNFYNQTFSLNHIMAESKNFWVFSR